MRRERRLLDRRRLLAAGTIAVRPWHSNGPSGQHFAMALNPTPLARDASGCIDGFVRADGKCEPHRTGSGTRVEDEAETWPAAAGGFVTDEIRLFVITAAVADVLRQAVE